MWRAARLSHNWLSVRRVNGECRIEERNPRGEPEHEKFLRRMIMGRGSHIRKDLSGLVYRSQTRQNRGPKLLVRLWRDLWRWQRQRNIGKRARVTRRRTIVSTAETVDQKQGSTSKRVIPSRPFQLSASSMHDAIFMKINGRIEQYLAIR